MGMHVDHGSLLSLSSNGLIAKVAVCATLFASYRAIYCNRHSETSAFPQPRPSANRAGQAARRRGDREQEVVQLNSKFSVRVNDPTQEDLEIKARRCSQKIKICGHAFRSYVHYESNGKH
jgi:hypothetical protein